MAMDDGNTNTEGRGLEGHTEKGKWLAFKARMDAANAVLVEQDRQMGRGRRRVANARLDPVKSWAVYLEVSEQYCNEALEQGQQDEKEAMEFLADVRREHHIWLAKLEEQESAQLIMEIEKVYGKGKQNDDETSPSSVAPRSERKTKSSIHRDNP